MKIAIGADEKNALTEGSSAICAPAVMVCCSSAPSPKAIRKSTGR